MEIKTLIIYFLSSFILIGCTSDVDKQTDKKVNAILFLDSLKMSRVGKPDWIDVGDYPKEEITLNFIEKKFRISRADTTVYEDEVIESTILEILLLSSELDTIHCGKKFNLDRSWDVDLKLLLFKTGKDDVCKIESFGHHGTIPKEMASLYRFLLRYMVDNIRQSPTYLESKKNQFQPYSD